MTCENWDTVKKQDESDMQKLSAQQEEQLRVSCLDIASRVGPGYDHLQLANTYYQWVKNGIFIPYSERPCQS